MTPNSSVFLLCIPIPRISYGGADRDPTAVPRAPTEPNHAEGVIRSAAHPFRVGTDGCRRTLRNSTTTGKMGEGEFSAAAMKPNRRLDRFV
ncbi:MAG: hypothetical protein ACRC1K_12405, partial [Planctomycetia bacterium]